MLCKICEGSGNIVDITTGKPKYTICEPCSGKGSTEIIGTGIIQIHKLKVKKSKWKLN